LVKAFSQAEEGVGGPRRYQFATRELKADPRKQNEHCAELDAAENHAAAVEETAAVVKGKEEGFTTESKSRAKLRRGIFSFCSPSEEFYRSITDALKALVCRNVLF
jgi:hypothetical protein